MTCKVFVGFTGDECVCGLSEQCKCCPLWISFKRLWLYYRQLCSQVRSTHSSTLVVVPQKHRVIRRQAGGVTDDRLHLVQGSLPWKFEVRLCPFSSRLYLVSCNWRAHAVADRYNVRNPKPFGRFHPHRGIPIQSWDL
jgi:hypothetical protein